MFLVGSALRLVLLWLFFWRPMWGSLSAPPTVRSARWCLWGVSGPNRTWTGSFSETSSWPGWGRSPLLAPSAPWSCTSLCLPSDWTGSDGQGWMWTNNNSTVLKFSLDTCEGLGIMRTFLCFGVQQKETCWMRIISERKIWSVHKCDCQSSYLILKYKY